MSFNIGDTLKLDVKKVVDDTNDFFGDWFIELAYETLKKGQKTLDVCLKAQRPDITLHSAEDSLNCLISVDDEIQYVPSSFLSKVDEGPSFKEGDVVKLDLKRACKRQKSHDYCFSPAFMEEIEKYICAGSEFVEVLVLENCPWHSEDELPIEISLRGPEGIKVTQWVPTIVLS